MCGCLALSTPVWLSCVYLWCHTHDKMYQALPLLSGESLGTRLHSMCGSQIRTWFLYFCPSCVCFGEQLLALEFTLLFRSSAVANTLGRVHHSHLNTLLIKVTWWSVMPCVLLMSLLGSFKAKSRDQWIRSCISSHWSVKYVCVCVCTYMCCVHAVCLCVCVCMYVHVCVLACVCLCRS